jgi:sialic acid synthase SpsE/mannose-6-phosphate isomerase-like protein (cupin superfamily)
MGPLNLKELTNNRPLLILDLANNHNGSLNHGMKIIEEISSVKGIQDFKVAIKFQYRNLPEFIHKDFRDRRDLKYVDRFISTALSWSDFEKLKNYISNMGFLTACTPFDEFSVSKIIEHEFDILKIASASFTDWPLLEAVNSWEKPIVASTAGSNLQDLDRVVTLFKNRNKDFALMHCVAAYPTEDKDLLINRISAMKERYSEIPIGYSTHEDPNNLIAGGLALAAGAVILERHVGTSLTNAPLNSYSSDKGVLTRWVTNLKHSIEMLGPTNPWDQINENEQKSLEGLRRFIFAKRDIKKGESIKEGDWYAGIPGISGQLQTKDAGKYVQVLAIDNLKADDPITHNNATLIQREARVFTIRDQIIDLVRKSNVVVPNNSVLEISHHYGLDNFEQFGTCMITVVNREYCKKLIFLLPGQTHPAMYHKVKDETFFLLYGDLDLKLDNKPTPIQEGGTVEIAPGVLHEFSSLSGAVVEEVSSSHLLEDSFYLDEEISKNSNRKTFIHYWL